MTGPSPFALVGPTYPYRGGIVEHTTALGQRLAAREALSEFASWQVQFPHRLYAGGISPAGTAPASHAAPIEVTRDLHWARPDSWRAVGSRLARDASHLLIVISTPLQLPAVAALSQAFRRRGAGRACRVTFVMHNVLPHERRALDRPLTRILLRSADAVIVHSEAEAALARQLGAQGVRTARLPFHPPPGLLTAAHPAGGSRLDRLAFLGFVRPYKGLDLLLHALALLGSGPSLIVHGEFWEPVERYRRLVKDLGLSDRVAIRPEYASTVALMHTLATVDAVVLPYRSATASQQPRIAFARGVPVIATAVGTLGQQVRDDVDGTIVTAVGAEGLATAIKEFYRDDRWSRFRQAVRPADEDAEWEDYLTVLRS